MRRTIVLLLVGVLVVPAQSVFATPATPMTDPVAVSDGTGPLDTGDDLTEALRFEALIPEHTFEGMVTNMLFDEWPHLDPAAQPIRIEGEADSGNYTGVYLAAQSWRYDQAKTELSRLGVDPLSSGPAGSEAVEFWRQQRDEARARATEIVGYYHMLVNIASVWDTELDLGLINPDYELTELGFLDFGGGIIPGEAGLLMRTCTPVDAARPWARVGETWPEPHRIGPLHWEGRDWYCLGSTSRDSYAGTVFGLSVALDFLAGDEHPELRATLAHDLMAITDYAIKYLWFQPRPHGVVANPLFGHNDLEGPISPLFIQVPLARLHLLQTARHAARVVGDATAALLYDVLWAAEMVASVTSGVLLASILVDATNPHDAYYKYQLNLMSFFNVIRLEPNPTFRGLIAQALAVQDATTRRHGNGFFEALIFGLTGDTTRLDDAVDRHREWLEYYAFHEQAAAGGNPPFLHTGRCGITTPAPPDAPIEQQPLACVPRNRVEMVLSLPILGELVVPFNPGSGPELRSTDPLPVPVRRYADFLWQKDPTIVGGDHNVPWRGPSIDFLATYWIIRYYSEIAVPSPQPLPTWSLLWFR